MRRATRRATLISLTAFALLGSAAVTLPTAPAFADLPKKSAPKGMLEISTGGHGRILTSRMGGTSSARKMLQALKMVSAEYFDKSFTITRAFVDRDDQHLQAAFTAKMSGKPVHGIASVQMNGESGQGTLLFDSADALVKSFSPMNKKLNAGGGGGNTGGGGGKMHKVALTRQTAPDGSCQISLPEGFTITGAFKGTLDISGPNGAAMALGAPILCTSKQAAGLFQGIPPVDFHDPIQAALDYAHYQAAKAGIPMNMKIIDFKRLPQGTMVGNAAYVRYSVQMSGKSMEGFGLFSISQTDINQGMLYESFIAAPTSSYKSSFPGMLQAWGTWSINPSVFTERLMAAAQSMRGMNDIITGGGSGGGGGHENADATYAKASESWSDMMRDQGTWQNPDNGDRYKVSNVYTNGGGIPMVNGTPLEPVATKDL